MKKAILVLTLVFFAISVAGAASLGASLTVPPLINTTLSVSYSPYNPNVNQGVKFIAEYKDENGTDIQGANLTITIDGQTYNMTPSGSKYVFYHTFQKDGIYFFKVNAQKVAYVPAEKESSLTIKLPTFSNSQPRTGINVIADNQTNTYLPTPPNENITIFTDVFNNFRKIVITTKLQIIYGNISIDKCKDRPNLDVFYDCISINFDRILPEQYSDIYIFFKVDKWWIKSNNINVSRIHVSEISSQNEKELKINKISEDENSYFFFTKTNNLSDFAIYGEKNDLYCGDKICSENENCSSCPQDCGECKVTSPEEKGWPLESLWLLILIPIIVYYFYQRKEKFSPEEIKKAKRRLNILEKRLKELIKKSKGLEKKLKRTKKKNPKNIGELKKLYEKIEDLKTEIANIEHKYNIKPPHRKKK